MISSLNQLNVNPIRYAEFALSETRINNKLGIIAKDTDINTKVQLGAALINDNNYSYDMSALSIVHENSTSRIKLNDPKDVLYLLRYGTGGESYDAKAKFAISRYENNLTYSRTRLDIDLAHNAFDDNNVMTLLSSKHVGIANVNPKYSLDVNGNVNVDLEENTYYFRYILIRNKTEAIEGIDFSINLSELQCWVDNSNVCQATNVSSSYVSESNSQFSITQGASTDTPASILINNSIDDFILSQNNNSHHILIDLQHEYDFVSLQAVVIYNSGTGEYNANKFKGLRLEFLDQNQQLTSFIDSELETSPIYKYKGPSYSSYPIDNTVQSFSSSNIIFDLPSNMKIYDFDSDVSANQFRGEVDKILRLTKGKITMGTGNQRSNIFIGLKSGENAKESNHDGIWYNTGVGYNSLTSIYDGDKNTAYGAKSLKDLSSENLNTAVGFESSQFLDNGSFNTSIGGYSLLKNISGNNNVAVGYQSLYTNESDDNTAVGWKSNYSNLTGTNNVTMSKESLYSNITGTENISIGNYSLHTNDSSRNIAIGHNSLHDNIISDNIAIGYESSYKNVSGDNNISIGQQASYSNLNSRENISIGTRALYFNDASFNIAIGHNARIFY